MRVPLDFFTEETIDPNNIWGNDDLKRKSFAGDLTRIVQHAAKRQSFTVSLHGGWGTGKTYLLQRWHAQLQQNSWQVVYFNAWEEDFQTNPLIAIVGQLWKEIKEGDFAEVGKSLKSFIGKLGEKILEHAGMEKQDLQSVAEQTVDRYLYERKQLEEFKARLKKLAGKVRRKTGFPLVFVVDELDRCRPTFALEVLERVKHLFSVRHVVFVFGVNKTELEKSIQSVYGDIDAEGYLRRFFDISLTLPSAHVGDYCALLLKRYDLRRALSGGWGGALDDFFIGLVSHMGLSLREVEHAVRLLRYAVNARRESNKMLSSMDAQGIALLILLKLSDASLYSEFVARKCGCGKVVDHFDRLLPEYYYIPGLRNREHRKNVPGDMWEAGRIAQKMRMIVYQFSLAESYAPDHRVERPIIIQGLQSIAQGVPVSDESIIGSLGRKTVNLHADNAKQIVHRFATFERLRRFETFRLEALAALLDLADDSNR